MVAKMVNVLKWNGRSEPFQREKVARTLLHLGASQKLADEIAGSIESEAREGITTKEIIDKIRSSLNEHGSSITLQIYLEPVTQFSQTRISGRYRQGISNPQGDPRMAFLA